MDKIDCIKAFICVVENGNFSKASTTLGITRDQVAKKICHLETSYKTPLFVRNTREMYLTPAGEKFYQHCKMILSEFEWATNELISEQKYLEGELRINAPHSFSQTFLTNIISDFMTKYPSIMINLNLSDKFSSIDEKNFDVLLTIDHNIDKNNSKVLSEHYCRFYAAPEYFEQYGIPKDLNELNMHSLLVYSQMNSNNKINLLKKNTPEYLYCSPKLTSNNGDVLLELCKNNQGIILIPDFLAIKEIELGNIILCLESYSSLPLYFLAKTPKKRSMGKKAELFLTFLEEHYSIFDEA